LLAACSETPGVRDGAVKPDRYRYTFPEAGDILSPDSVPAADDRCGGASPIKLSGGKAKVSGSTQGALSEFGDQVRCGETQGFGGPQRYYSLGMEAGRVYRFVLTPQFDAVLYVFSECSKTLINVDCASGGATGAFSGPVPAQSSGVVTFIAPAKGIYRLAVDSPDASQAGAFELVVEEQDTPKNAVCTDAETLVMSGGKASVSDSTLGAKNEFDTQIACGLTATLDGPQLYYEVDLQAGTWYRLTLKPSFPATLYVANKAGSCEAKKIEQDCSGLTGTVLSMVPQGGEAATAFKPPTTGTYLVVVDSPDSKEAGPFDLTIESFTPPTGAICASAQKLTLVGGQVTVAGSTTGSLNDLGALVGCGAGEALLAPQVYYQAALEAKAYRLMLQASFPAVLSVGTACLTLPVDCVSGGVTGDALVVPAGTFGALLFKPAAAGTFIISVDGTSLAASGNFNLQVSEYVKPTNGSCGQPKTVALAKNPTEELGDTGPLANDLQGVDCGDPKGPWPGPQAYYRLSLKAGTQYTLTLKPEASFDPALYAFPAATGCTTAEVNAACTGLASDTPGAGAQESLTIKPAADTDYVVVVDSWSASEVGTFALEVSSQ
jgi:hypothetical protein